VPLIDDPLAAARAEIVVLRKYAADSDTALDRAQHEIERLRAALATRPEPLPRRCWALIADLSETIPTHHTAVAALRERARDLWAEAAAGSATAEEAEPRFVWATCETCGGNIFRRYAWEHEGGTPPQDHDAEPAAGSATPEEEA